MDQAGQRQLAEQQIRRYCDAGLRDDATTLILETYGSELMGFLVARLRDHDLAAEAFSELALDLWRGIGTFEGRSSARVWAYAVLRHALARALDRHRRNHHNRVPLSEAAHLSKLADAVRTATLSYLKTDKRDGLAVLREKLSPDDQTLLILRVNERLEWKDVAMVMSYDGRVPQEAALRREAARLRKRFQLVKDQLRKLASDAGLLEAELD